MSYTVKQLGKLAGVSARTLHYYDEIGLLRPGQVGDNGYRYYREPDLLRLQQVLFYKELGLSLTEIKDVLDRPGFELLAALQTHRLALRDRSARLRQLIDTVDRTIGRLKGEHEMSDKALFQGFSEEQQKEYEVEARDRWGATVDESTTRWYKYSQDQKDAILAAGGAIMQGVYDNMGKGHEHPDVQKYIAAWHKHMGFFYSCSLEIFEGLGHGYVADPRFKENYEKMFGPGMAEFLEEAMTYYVALQRGNES